MTRDLILEIMALPRYKYCCCFDVKTGALILGMIGFFCAGFGLVSDSVGLGVYAPQVERMLDDLKEQSMEEFESMGAPEDQRPYYEAFWNKLDLMQKLTPWIFVGQIVTSAFSFLINGAMIYGLMKAKPGFMMPWMVVNMAGIVLCSAVMTMGFFVLAVGTPGGFLSAFLLLLLCTPFLAVGLYLWLVVRSAYLEIRENVTPNTEDHMENAGRKYVKM